MGLFGSSSEKNENARQIPPEILARISVLGDHAPIHQAKEPEKIGSDTSIPSVATPAPHGPSESFSQGPVNAPEMTRQAAPPTFAVSPEVAESSPFLQELSPQELVVSKKEAGGIEPPMFLSEKINQNQFGFGQNAQTNFSNRTVSLASDRNISFSDTQSSSSSHRAIWIFSFFFLLLILGLAGAYYFLYIYSVQTVVQSPTKNGGDSTIDTKAGDGEERMQSEFSLDSPNYLPLNVETVSAEDIQTRIQKIGETLKNAGITKPVEFFVTDQSNTPIAFSRFALLSGMKFPDEVISLTDETFSLFVYEDQGMTRVGLRISLQKNDAPAAVFKKNESVFPFAMQSMFFKKNIPPLKKSLFKEGSYRGIPVRYSNIPGVDALSIDYAVLDGEWYIGTSKDTVRGMLDQKIK